MGEKRGLRGLQAWCRIVTEGHKNVHVCDMSSSWRDGLAFCALIHHFRPDLIDFDSLSQDDIMFNNRLAFTVAEQHLGIPALLDPEDMLKYEEPDKLSIATYVSQFYQYFEGRGRAEDKLRTPLKRSFVERAFTPTALPAKVPLKGFKRDEKCLKCRNRVFILERLMVDSKLYHRMCFQCCRCATVLRPGAYAKGDEEDTYECIVCPVDEKPPLPKSASPEAELKNMNNKIQSDESDAPPMKKVTPVTEINLSINNSVKAAQKEFLERELSSSGSFTGSLDVSTEKILTVDSNSSAIDASSERNKESKVMPSRVATRDDNLRVKSAHLSNLIDVAYLSSTTLNATPLAFAQSSSNEETEEKVKTGESVTSLSSNKNELHGKPEMHSVPSVSDLPTSEKCEDKTKTVFLQEKAFANADEKQNGIEKERANSVPEEQPTPPMRSRKKHQDSSATLTRNGNSLQSLNTSISNFRRFSSTIELSRNKETPSTKALSPTTALPTITSPTYNLPTSSSDTSLPGKIKIPEAFQRISSPTTALTSDTSVSPLSRSALLQSRYSSYNRSLSNRSLHTILNEPPAENKMAVKPLEPVGTDEVSSGVQLKNSDNSVAMRRHSADDNQMFPIMKQESSSSDASCPDNSVSNEAVAMNSDSVNTDKQTELRKSVRNHDTSVSKTVPDVRPSSSKGIEKTEKKTQVIKKPVVTVNVIRKVTPASKLRLTYPGELNPFGDFEEEKNAEEIYPDELNPFEDSDEETEEYEKLEHMKSVESLSRNSSSLQLSLHGSDYNDLLNPFCDSEDDLSLDCQSPSTPSSGRAQTPKKKKPPAPPPPLFHAATLSVLNSSKPSSPKASPASSLRSSPRVQKRLAPKPPDERSAIIVDEKSKNPEQEKATKEQNNLSIMKNSDTSSEVGQNTNTFGYWKRKKRPAPSVPVPKRQIRHVPLKEIQDELEEIWEKQAELESQGRQLEMSIRDQPDAGGDTNDDEDLILQLFELVNQKNILFRRQAELMYIKRSQSLEEEQAELEYQIRCLMSKHEKLRTAADKAREDELLQRLVDVVEHRNEIVESMDMDRQRVQDEDLSLKEQFARQASTGDSNQNLAVESMPEEKTKKKKSKFKDKFKKEKDPNKKSSKKDKKS